jgi:hypothetical protein
VTAVVSETKDRCTCAKDALTASRLLRVSHRRIVGTSNARLGLTLHCKIGKTEDRQRRRPSVYLRRLETLAEFHIAVCMKLSNRRVT